MSYFSTSTLRNNFVIENIENEPRYIVRSVVSSSVSRHSAISARFEVLRQSTGSIVEYSRGDLQNSSIRAEKNYRAACKILSVSLFVAGPLETATQQLIAKASGHKYSMLQEAKQKAGFYLPKSAHLQIVQEFQFAWRPHEFFFLNSFKFTKLQVFQLEHGEYRKKTNVIKNRLKLHETLIWQMEYY